ncbi:hypothetical protein HMPREF1579_00882 [Gardnerella vaginalis JCP8066]|nr:hypothetical protein HMPREF1579_00882 [Gardnerella vaginalis JCP8066]
MSQHVCQLWVIGKKVHKAKLMNILKIELVSLALDYKAILFIQCV